MRRRNDQTLRRYGGIIGQKAIRIVWATVTQHPEATVNELRDLSHLNRVTVARALAVLRDAGYIEQLPFKSRARRIVVPFAFVETTQ